MSLDNLRGKKILLIENLPYSGLISEHLKQPGLTCEIIQEQNAESVLGKNYEGLPEYLQDNNFDGLVVHIRRRETADVLIQVNQSMPVIALKPLQMTRDIDPSLFDSLQDRGIPVIVKTAEFGKISRSIASFLSARLRDHL